MKYLISLNVISFIICIILAYNQYATSQCLDRLREDNRVNRYLWEDLRVNHNTAEALNKFFNSHFDRLKNIENDIKLLKENKNEVL